MNTWLKVSRHPRSGGMMGSLLLAGVLLAGCGGEDTTTGYVDVPGSDPVPIVVNTPAQIAQVSADDYDDNVNGLITGATLQRWIDDWQSNRPAGITGRLIILQINNGPEGKEYITPKPEEGVLTYSIPSSRLTMYRSNGVTTTRSMVPDGAAMDSFFTDYGIDPRQDMLVCAMGTGGNSPAMSMGRCWYMLRYWGVAREHLAQLNGGASNANVMDQSYLGSVVTCDEGDSDACLPRSGWVSVRNLPQDNTALQATMGDVIDVVEGRASAFIWDARNQAQYLGTGFQNSNARAGHPRGSVQLDYTNMLISSDNSYRYKPKAQLAAYLNGETVDGAEFVGYDSGAVIPLGVGNAYQPGETLISYCETTFRAMITGTAAGVVLGLPVRFYDGAMVEWNSMSHIQDKNGQFILPADSPWRTDTLARSVFEYSTGTIEPRLIDDPYAANTNAIIQADKAYKTGSSSAGGDSSGGGLPSNPCGG